MDRWIDGQREGMEDLLCKQKTSKLLAVHFMYVLVNTRVSAKYLVSHIVVFIHF